MHNTAVKAIEQKKRALAEGDEATMRQVGEGNDIMSILCGLSPSNHCAYPYPNLTLNYLVRANMEASNEEALSDAEIIGQMS
jgi:hypothetical protein